MHVEKYDGGDMRQGTRFLRFLTHLMNDVHEGDKRRGFVSNLWKDGMMDEEEKVIDSDIDDDAGAMCMGDKVNNA